MIKKIIWFLMLFPMFLTKVNAYETYYTDYSEYTDFQEKEVLASELVNVIEETRYLWYKNETIEEYELYTKGHGYEDCYETEFSPWYDGEANILLESRTYETRKRYDYQMALPVRYIHLTNFDLNKNFNMTELKVYVKGKEASFITHCQGCSSGFKENIKNGLLDDSIYIASTGSISIDLGTYYPIDDINIVFYMNNTQNNQFTLTYETENNTFSKNYTINKNDEIISKTIYDIEPDTNKWLYDDYSYSFFINDFVFNYEIVPVFRYKEKYCKTIKTEKIYNDIYTKESVSDYMYKDEQKYKTYYKYQTRDKIILDVYEINTRDFDLNDFVIYSSNDYEIIDNITIYKNGEYQLKFKIGSLEIIKNVTVDIEENVVNQLEEELNLYKNKIKDLNKVITVLENQLNIFEIDKENLKKMILEKENIIKKYKEEVLSLNNEIHTLNEKLHFLEINNQILNEEYIKKQNKIDEIMSLNLIYKEKINELEIDLNLTNKQINSVITNSDNRIN